MPGRRRGCREDLTRTRVARMERPLLTVAQSGSLLPMRCRQIAPDHAQFIIGPAEGRIGWPHRLRGGLKLSLTVAIAHAVAARTVAPMDRPQGRSHGHRLP